MFRDVFEGMSHPYAALEAEVLDAIAGEHAAQVVASFTDRFSVPLAEAGGGLASYLEGWSAHEPRLGDVWNTAFGAAENLARGTSASAGAVRRHAVELALAMQEAGRAGGLRVDLDAAVPLRFGRWCLPPATRVAVDGDGERVRIDFDGGLNGSCAVFARDGEGAWALEDGAATPLARTPVRERALHFLPPALADEDRGEELAYEVVPADERVVSAWAAALELIGRAEPRYLGWIDRGIRDIVPLDVPGGKMVSGSRTRRWGEVFMTAVLEPLQLCEMLVHEVSHQHYFLGLMVSPVHDGSDETLYYSPLKRRGRPIDKILLGYHAFANVVLFYRACRARGIETHVEEAKILPELAELEAPLRETRALTELGRAIWEPLAERLEATRDAAPPTPGPSVAAAPAGTL